LDTVTTDADIISLLGDNFDFWFEYKTVVPKGFVRLFGKLAELTDAGIQVHFFIGNHDLWTFGYFEEEIGMKVHYKPLTVTHSGKQFFLAHGDGLLTQDKKFKFLRNVFHSKLLQQLFALVPPRIGQRLGYKLSMANRMKIEHDISGYRGEDKEELVQFSKAYSADHQIDYFVFGHRHLDLKLQLKNDVQVIILGDFVSIFSYGVFDGKEFRLEYF
jgi:UDP-2,3-diacylglucosamine hydrolase